LVIGLLAAGCGGGGTAAWDYVALGDSVPYGAGDVAGRSFVYVYARQIQADTGARVRVHNLATDGGTSGELLNRLRQDSDLRRALRRAEVITVSIGGNDLESHIGDYAAAACGGSDNQNCFRAAVVSFGRTWQAIVSVVLNLRDREHTIIRVTNDYNPFPGNVRAAENLGRRIGPVFTLYLRHLNALRCRIARRNRIPCADVARAFNGPLTDQSAFAKGLIGSDEFAHPSARGHAVIAQTLRALGYQPLHG
jgi:lysophospholipase L1-like esterase